MRDRRIRRVHLAGQHIDRRQIPLVTVPDFFEPLGILVVGQELSRAELRRPLEGHTVFAFTRPLALQIGVAPRRPFDPLPACLRAGCALRDEVCRYDEHQQADEDPEGDSASHVIAPVTDSKARQRRLLHEVSFLPTF